MSEEWMDGKWWEGTGQKRPKSTSSIEKSQQIMSKLAKEQSECII